MLLYNPFISIHIHSYPLSINVDNHDISWTFFRKIFNLLFHGHCMAKYGQSKYYMDNCPWTIDAHGQLSTKRT
jgi:hypothetical protein